MRRFRGRLSGLLVATSCLTLTAAAQGPVFSVRTETVRVDVSVLDRGQIVLGLAAGDFELLDNGVPQRIDLVGFDETPVSVMLALDMSGSVQGPRLDHLRAAGLRLVSALRPGDTAGLVVFSDRVVMRRHLTSEFDLLATALRRPAPGGDTALIDATYAAMLAGSEGTGRPIVLVFSDGADTASFLMPDLVLDVARRVGPVVYAVASPGAGRGGFLDELVTLTGGRRLDAALDRLGDSFTALLDEARLRYLLSYTPEGVASGGWHELTVRIRNRPGLEIRARPGYLATP